MGIAFMAISISVQHGTYILEKELCEKKPFSLKK